jgi:hypothetical protein
MATVGAALTSEKNTSRLSYITVAAFVVKSFESFFANPVCKK